MHSERSILSRRDAPPAGTDAATLGWRSVLARLVPYLLITLIANTMIAVLLTATLPPPHNGFFSNFVYSQFIGLSILLLFTLPRLTYWPRENLAPWQVALHLAAAMVIGFVGGSYGASFVLGTPPLIAAREPGDRLLSAALVTVLASVACTSFFWLRERVAALRLEASNQRGRAEAERARAEAASRQASEAQLNLIRTQLEPHMLFNTLANLRSLMASDPPRAQVMVDHLIAFLRATLTASRHDKVTLKEEFDVLRDYLALISIRMGPRLRHSLDLPPGLGATTVLPLLLQPLVENAVRHGIEPAIEGGRIDVSARAQGEHLELIVEDTGVGFTGERIGFGLAQVRERLQTAYGASAALVVESPLPRSPSRPLAQPAVSAGARVTLTLPLTLPVPVSAAGAGVRHDEAHSPDR